MTSFCLLSDPATYRALDWDLAEAPRACAEWLDLFEQVFAEILHHACEVYGDAAETRIVMAREKFSREMAVLRENPAAFQGGQLNLLELDRIRDQILRANGLPDPFSRIKARENRAAMALYPKVISAHQALEGRDKWFHLIEGVIAGNTFDLGATATLNLGRDSQDFLACIENTKPRPWLEDDFDALAARLLRSAGLPWQKAVILVDNAGSDFILGVLPFARELLRGGVRVVLAANELPSLNDITAGEAYEVVKALASEDRILREAIENDELSIVSSGNDLPVIDLSRVSNELNRAAAGAGLLVLEGMGRAVETNYDAAFNADVLRICLIKNESVARRIGGNIFDCICRFTPSQSPCGLPA